MGFLGNILITGTLACTVVSLVMYLLVWRGKTEFTGLARKSFVAATVLVTAAILDLWYLILTHDFTIAYVYSYSSTDLPLGYLISTLWGGQEGTFLLWVFMTSVLGIVMMRTSKKFETGNMFFLNIFILSILLILFKQSPFEPLPVIRTEGAGLNPLLQNFWMQIHPPIMFLGFSGAVFPFCFALTALVEKRFKTWAEAARRWTMFAFVSLGTSLVMGGYWAYETLGWGGFWAWDPVENSSFIPWIFLTVQVHALFIKRMRSGLLRFSLFIVMLSFWSVLYGTFLTRSGVLADFSVHSFVDLGLNNYLAGGLLFFITLGLSLLFYRWQEIHPEPSFSSVNSRSYLVTLGIIILFIGGVLVLLGTSAPLLTRVTENPSAVGLPYYFATMTPVAVAVLFLLLLFPAYKWNDGIARPKFLWIAASVSAATIIGLIAFGVTTEILYLLLFGFAAAAITINGYVVWRTWRDKPFKPGYLAHVGLATALIGAASSAGFEEKKTITLLQDEKTSVMGYDILFSSIDDRNAGFDCHVEIGAGENKFTAVLEHDFPKNADGIMRKPHVEVYLSHDLYVAPVAIERPDEGQFIEMTLEKGESGEVNKYSVMFDDFDLDSHGDADRPARATAELEISFDGQTIPVKPYLQVTDNGVVPIEVPFDSSSAAVMIAGVNPDEGTVTLRFIGEIFQAPGFQPASLTIELSRKPLIVLFWIGTFLMFLSGGLSMRESRRRAQKKIAESAEPERATAGAIS